MLLLLEDLLPNLLLLLLFVTLLQNSLSQNAGLESGAAGLRGGHNLRRLLLLLGGRPDLHNVRLLANLQRFRRRCELNVGRDAGLACGLLLLHLSVDHLGLRGNSPEDLSGRLRLLLRL